MCSFVTTPALAEVTPAQRKKVLALRTSVRRAGNFFSQEKYEQSGALIEQIQSEMDALLKDGDKDVAAALVPIYNSLKKAHALLELEGVKLAPLKNPAEMAKPNPVPGGGISFTKQVAPLLVGKCGRCHVENARGMFSMANYDALMEGNNDGKVVFGGDADGSRVVEVIVEGDMPRGGLKVAAPELAMLKKWILEGAKYDGQDTKVSLTTLAPNVSTDLPKIGVTRSTGKETISFSKDLAPVLNEQCANCHGNGRRPSGRFNLTNFTAMLRGGESGPPVLPKKPAESLLIQKLKGTTSGERMPRQQPPLSDEVIAKFETWISEGATFDGPDPAQHVEVVAELAWAAGASHEDLSARRAERAAKNWALGMPGIDGDIAETENFYVTSNLGTATTEDLGKQAEKLVPRIVEIFDAPSDKPLLKGRMSLYFFRTRYDYSEFGKMVERRELPRQWRGHWKFSVVDAYAAMQPPRAEEFDAQALLAQQIGAAYVASLATDVPAWFAEGSGRFAARRINADDERIAKWDAQLAEALGQMENPDDFLTGKLSPAQAAVVSYSFVQFLMKDSRRYKKVLNALRDGQPFATSFSDAYNGSPSQVAAIWARSASRSSKKQSR
jgi:hypothetical protein